MANIAEGLSYNIDGNLSPLTEKIRQAEQRLADSKRRVEANKIKLTLQVDDRAVQEAERKLNARLTGSKSFKIRTDFDTSAGEKKLDALAKRLSTSMSKVKVDLDTSAAERKIEVLSRKMSSLSGSSASSVGGISSGVGAAALVPHLFAGRGGGVHSHVHGHQHQHMASVLPVPTMASTAVYAGSGGGTRSSFSPTRQYAQQEASRAGVEGYVSQGMPCPRCGRVNSNTAVHCVRCGQRLRGGIGATLRSAVTAPFRGAAGAYSMAKGMIDEGESFARAAYFGGTVMTGAAGVLGKSVAAIGQVASLPFHYFNYARRAAANVAYHVSHGDILSKPWDDEVNTARDQLKELGIYTNKGRFRRDLKSQIAQEALERQARSILDDRIDKYGVQISKSSVAAQEDVAGVPQGSKFSRRVKRRQNRKRRPGGGGGGVGGGASILSHAGDPYETVPPDIYDPNNRSNRTMSSPVGPTSDPVSGGPSLQMDDDLSAGTVKLGASTVKFAQHPDPGLMTGALAGTLNTTEQTLPANLMVDAFAGTQSPVPQFTKASSVTDKELGLAEATITQSIGRPMDWEKVRNVRFKPHANAMMSRRKVGDWTPGRSQQNQGKFGDLMRGAFRFVARRSRNNTFSATKSGGFELQDPKQSMGSFLNANPFGTPPPKPPIESADVSEADMVGDARPLDAPSGPSAKGHPINSNLSVGGIQNEMEKLYQQMRASAPGPKAKAEEGAKVPSKLEKILDKFWQKTTRAPGGGAKPPEKTVYDITPPEEGGPKGLSSAFNGPIPVESRIEGAARRAFANIGSMTGDRNSLGFGNPGANFSEMQGPLNKSGTFYGNGNGRFGNMIGNAFMGSNGEGGGWANKGFFNGGLVKGGTGLQQFGRAMTTPLGGMGARMVGGGAALGVALGNDYVNYQNAQMANVSGDPRVKFNNMMGAADSLNKYTLGTGNLIDYAFNGNARGNAMKTMAEAEHGYALVDQRVAHRGQVAGLRAGALGLNDDLDSRLAAVDLSGNEAQLQRREAMAKIREERGHAAAQLDDQGDYAGARQARARDKRELDRMESEGSSAQKAYTDAQKAAISRKDAAEMIGLRSQYVQGGLAFTNSLGAQEEGIKGQYDQLIAGTNDPTRQGLYRGLQNQAITNNRIQYGLDTQDMGRANVVGGLTLQARELGNSYQQFGAAQQTAQAGIVQAGNVRTQALRGLDMTDPAQRQRAQAIQDQHDQTVAGFKSDQARNQADYAAALGGMDAGNRAGAQRLLGNHVAAAVEENRFQRAEAIRTNADPGFAPRINERFDQQEQGIHMSEAQRKLGLRMNIDRLNDNSDQQAQRNRNMNQTADAMGIISDTKQQIRQTEIDLPGEENKKAREQTVAALRKNANTRLDYFSKELGYGNHGQSVGGFINFGDSGNTAFKDMREAVATAKGADAAFDATEKGDPNANANPNAPTRQQIQDIITAITQLAGNL